MSPSVLVGAPPRNAPIVAVVVQLDVQVPADSAAEALTAAAEHLRRAGLVLALLPADVEYRRKRPSIFKSLLKGKKRNEQKT